MMIHRITINVCLSLAAADFAVAYVLPTAIDSEARHTQSSAAIANEGAFEYNSDVGNGNLVVSFEPFSDEPTPTPQKNSSTPLNESCILGVELPENEEVPPRVDNEHTKNLVGHFLGAALPIVGPLLGQPQSEGLQVMQHVFVDSRFNSKVPDRKDYKLFGNGNHSENLTYLVKTNPFVASALTEREGGGFEILSFDPEDPDNQKNASLYRNTMATLSGPGRRVNFRFDDKMKITGFRVFDDITGKRIMEDDGMQEEMACAAL
jgi:hypothetical protein